MKFIACKRDCQRFPVPCRPLIQCLQYFEAEVFSLLTLPERERKSWLIRNAQKIITARLKAFKSFPKRKSKLQNLFLLFKKVSQTVVTIHEHFIMKRCKYRFIYVNETIFNLSSRKTKNCLRRFNRTLPLVDGDCKGVTVESLKLTTKIINVNARISAPGRLLNFLRRGEGANSRGEGGAYLKGTLISFINFWPQNVTIFTSS